MNIFNCVSVRSHRKLIDQPFTTHMLIRLFRKCNKILLDNKYENLKKKIINNFRSKFFSIMKLYLFSKQFRYEQSFFPSFSAPIELLSNNFDSTKQILYVSEFKLHRSLYLWYSKFKETENGSPKTTINECISTYLPYYHRRYRFVWGRTKNTPCRLIQNNE